MPPAGCRILIRGGTPEVGRIGPVTLAGVARADPNDLITQCSELRRDCYRNLPIWHVFGAGGTRRLLRTRRSGLAMARALAPGAGMTEPLSVADGYHLGMAPP